MRPEDHFWVKHLEISPQKGSMGGLIVTYLLILIVAVAIFSSPLSKKLIGHIK
ncbi:hypothetical protein [Desulfosarcina alkanivorans]|uniref:hypothetical protein n=1 Tax=Desulfosarcina alkanivorans TaxID=571177 RepID=UPI0012D35264|nr:hypothetical protein [Desulfosarcina alkanivorans]